MDTDCGKDSSGAESSRESLVASSTVRQRTRLSTSAIPYGNQAFEVEFDFLDHNLVIRQSNRATKYVPLDARPVAEALRGVVRGQDSRCFSIRERVCC